MKINADPHSLENARKYAFLLLKFRLRTEQEIQERLKKKNFTSQVIAATIAFLKEKGFINDRDFARLWISSRLKKPFGLRRIRQELRSKGVRKDIIEAGVGAVDRTYDEDKIISEIIRKKISKAGALDPDKAKRRICGYLIRRGFSPDKVFDAIQSIEG